MASSSSLATPIILLLLTLTNFGQAMTIYRLLCSAHSQASHGNYQKPPRQIPLTRIVQDAIDEAQHGKFDFTFRRVSPDRDFSEDYHVTRCDALGRGAKSDEEPPTKPDDDTSPAPSAPPAPRSNSIDEQGLGDEGESDGSQPPGHGKRRAKPPRRRHGPIEPEGSRAKIGHTRAKDGGKEKGKLRAERSPSFDDADMSETG